MSDGSSSSSAGVDAAVVALRGVLLASHERRLDAAAKLGLTVNDTVALSLLASSDEVIAGQLADCLGVAPSTATYMIDRLERAGLARRTRHPQDRRVLTISLTPAARQAFDLGTGTARRALGTLTDKQLADVTSAFILLAQALSDNG